MGFLTMGIFDKGIIDGGIFDDGALMLGYFYDELFDDRV